LVLNLFICLFSADETYSADLVLNIFLAVPAKFLLGAYIFIYS
jgi:hypothetical protein